MSDTEMTEAGAIVHEAFEAASKHLRGEIVTITDPRDGTTAPAILADGIHVINPREFDGYRKLPTRREGSAGHTRLDSFIDHVNRFKGDNSAVFAVDNMAGPKLTAIYDYHPAGYSSDAENMKHRATYSFPLSDEWKAWSSANGKPMPMMDFASFLEDHIVDVTTDKPKSDAAKEFLAKTGGNLASPSKLIEIARGLQVNEASTLREARNLSSGEAEVVFQSEHLDANGNKLTLPNAFMICIPVFARATVFDQILARFRYRKSGNGLVFWFDLWRPDLVFEHAFTEACEMVKKETTLPASGGSGRFPPNAPLSPALSAGFPMPPSRSPEFSGAGLNAF